MRFEEDRKPILLRRSENGFDKPIAFGVILKSPPHVQSQAEIAALRMALNNAVCFARHIHAIEPAERQGRHFRSGSVTVNCTPSNPSSASRS